jgi:hypothetical protein
MSNFIHQLQKHERLFMAGNKLFTLRNQHEAANS